MPNSKTRSRRTIKPAPATTAPAPDTTTTTAPATTAPATATDTPTAPETTATDTPTVTTAPDLGPSTVTAPDLGPSTVTATRPSVGKTVKQHTLADFVANAFRDPNKARGFTVRDNLATARALKHNRDCNNPDGAIFDPSKYGELHCDLPGGRGCSAGHEIPVTRDDGSIGYLLESHFAVISTTGAVLIRAGQIVPGSSPADAAGFVLTPFGISTARRVIASGVPFANKA